MAPFGPFYPLIIPQTKKLFTKGAMSWKHFKILLNITEPILSVNFKQLCHITFWVIRGH